MKLLPAQMDEISLSAFGEEARAMLMRRDYSGLANRYGYALAHERWPSAAIEADFLSAMASPHKLGQVRSRQLQLSTLHLTTQVCLQSLNALFLFLKGLPYF